MILDDEAVKRMISMLEERDALTPIDKECDKFGIKRGDTVIDYGCGSGGYTTKISKLVGNAGKVYAVDLYELAIAVVKKKIDKFSLENIQTVLVKDLGAIQDNIADIIIAIDMFHMVEDTDALLSELHRLVKKNGSLFISTHHLSSEEVKEKITRTELWEIVDEVENTLKCMPLFISSKTSIRKDS